jgi:pilus assembly protein CpaB
MKRTIIGVIAAVALAAIGTTVLVGFVRGAEDRALAGQETVEVLVVRETIERGTAADQIGASVVSERIPAKVQANGSVVNLEDLDGQVAAVDLVAGEQLLAGRFASPAQLEAESDIEVPDGLQQVTISLSPDRAVGGQIRPGDTIGLFASFNFDDGRGEEEIANEEQEYLRQELSETSKMILHKLLVTNVQVEQLPQQATQDDDESSSGPDLAPTGNLLITLAIDVPQAERIIFAAEHGTIWLSSEDENADESGSRLRTPRNIYDD